MGDDGAEEGWQQGAGQGGRAGAGRGQQGQGRGQQEETVEANEVGSVTGQEQVASGSRQQCEGKPLPPWTHTHERLVSVGLILAFKKISHAK